MEKCQLAAERVVVREIEIDSTRPSSVDVYFLLLTTISFECVDR